MFAEFVEFFREWWGAFLLLVGGSTAGVWTVLNRRGGERAARKNPLPPSWPEMWARIDAQDTRIDALEIELADTTRKYDALVTETVRKDDQIDELIVHILKLEPLIPTPPGAPARPAWIKR